MRGIDERGSEGLGDDISARVISPFISFSRRQPSPTVRILALMTPRPLPLRTLRPRCHLVASSLDPFFSFYYLFCFTNIKYKQAFVAARRSSKSMRNAARHPRNALNYRGYAPVWQISHWNGEYLKRLASDVMWCSDVEAGRTLLQWHCWQRASSPGAPRMLYKTNPFTWCKKLRWKGTALRNFKQLYQPQALLIRLCVGTVSGLRWNRSIWSHRFREAAVRHRCAE